MFQTIRHETALGDVGRRRRRRGAGRAAAGAVFATTLVLAGCSSGGANSASGTKGDGAASATGGSGGTKKVSLTLNYLPGGAQAGFMYGKSLGLFDKAGIDLKIIPGSGSLTTAQLVASGKVKIGYIDASTAFQVAAKGGAITVVSPILQENGYAVISLQSSGIDSIAKLKGQRVATVAGVAPTVLLPAVLKSGGLKLSDVETSNITSSAQVGSLLTGKFKAIIATGDVQSPQLEERGQKINTMFYYKNGVPTVGESIVVNSNYLKSHADLVRSFVKASLQSWDATRKDPHAAAEAEAKQFPAEGSVQQQEDQIKVDIRLLCAAPGATQIGKVPESAWTRTQSLLKKYKLLPQSADYTKYVNTDYLPANPPSCP